jgi:hypothetical protein
MKCLRRKKNPRPVSGASSSSLRGLFHPNERYANAFLLRFGFKNVKSE